MFVECSTKVSLCCKLVFLPYVLFTLCNFRLHCSDGWDRTAQLSGLSQLLSDPFYRTIEGFQRLIEKDFCLFGHNFGTRSSIDSNDYSPIFIQFLDAGKVHAFLLLLNSIVVWQCWQQFPNEFEFNESFLELLILVHVNRYTFDFILDIQSKRKAISLFDKMCRPCGICRPLHAPKSEQSQNETGFRPELNRENTIQCSCNKDMINSSCLISVWNIVKSNMNRYLNIAFAPSKRLHEGKRRTSTSSTASDGSIINLRERLRYIEPNCGMHCLHVWKKVHSYGLPTINEGLSENFVVKNIYHKALESQRKKSDALAATIRELQKQLDEAKSKTLPKANR